jgi:hypothetical protein
MLLNQRNESFGGMRVKVAVDNGVFFLAFHNRRDGENRQWKTSIARFGGFRIIEKDHEATVRLTDYTGNLVAD